jgi:hypothetical protein
MRFLTELYGKHKGQPIWIIGSDPTLDSYPDDFLNGKIGMTLHMAHVKFPRASYRYANEVDRVEYLADNYPDFLKQDNIFSWPFYWKTKRYSKNAVKGGDPWFHRLRSYQPWGIRGFIDWKFTEKKVRQAVQGRSINFGGHGTCLHGAMFTALYLGCNEINLIGCGHGMVSAEKEHFGSINEIDKQMRPGIPLFSDPENNVPMIEQTLAIIAGCEKMGIKINWIKKWSADLNDHICVDKDHLMKKKKQLKKRALTLKYLIRLAIMPLNWLINSF